MSRHPARWTPAAGVLAAALVAAVGMAFAPPAAQPAASAAREDAYRSNNLGVALLEQFNYEPAAEAFRKALAVDPSLAIARFNLAVALYNARDLAGARREAEEAARLLPDTPHPHYLLGLVAKAENRTADAIAAFRRVLELDANDAGAGINLAQMLLQERRYDEAIEAVRRAVAAEPYNVTAVYNLGIALTRAGQRDEGARVMQRFTELRDSGYKTVIGQNYLEQGRYAEAIASTGSEAALVSPEPPDARFVDASAELPRELQGDSGSLLLFDYDDDGALDLFVAGPAGQRLYRNSSGRFADTTAAAGLKPGDGGLAALAGDYDNDRRPDLLVLRAGGPTLYRSQETGGFADVTASSGLPAGYSASVAAWSDVDHDGDLDLLLGGAPNRLLRNNGNGAFADVTKESGLAAASEPLVAVVPTDYDDRRDVDLLLARATAPALFRNMRDGTFRDVAAEVGLAAPGGGALRLAAVAAADVNKDRFTDFLLAASEGQSLLALSNGRGGFATTAAPAGLAGVRAAHFLDYDNDGLLDLFALTGAGPRLLRHAGARWDDVSARALSAAGSAAGDALASGDLDGDGDTDAVVRLAKGGVRLWRNEGGNRNRSVRVRLSGLVSNRSAVGAKVEVRAGSLWQKLETYAATPAPAPADAVFGIGNRVAADAVRVLWPAGILQTETAAAAAGQPAAPPSGPLVGSTVITELDRKPSSCPYLYAWDGERFEFVTDFLGGGEVGYWMAPGVRNQPDPDEYVRIEGRKLRPRDGRYELRVTNELEEVLFLDHARLLAVDHPADVEVFPHEGLVGPPGYRYRLHAARSLRPLVRAMDDHGHDVLPRLLEMDRTWPDDFRRHRIRGYAEQHSLTLDLGPRAGDDTLLLLTGWTDYAFSSDNVAAHQAGLSMSPPRLEVRDVQGRWQTAVGQVGIPVGRPQTLVVELGGRWLSPSREVRIVTNMRIYWDQALVADAAPVSLARVQPIEARAADLRWRGFSAETSPDGREPWGYDYRRVSAFSPWKLMPGRYTREGDVRELVAAVDDAFVISRPGDDLALSFPALAEPPSGWKRTFLLHADGFSKEMDINSASPDVVEPLPFHGMSGYPYPVSESYPMTEARRQLFAKYNTRLVGRTLPPLDLSFTPSPAPERSTGRAGHGSR